MIWEIHQETSMPGFRTGHPGRPAKSLDNGPGLRVQTLAGFGALTSLRFDGIPKIWLIPLLDGPRTLEKSHQLHDVFWQKIVESDFRCFLGGYVGNDWNNFTNFLLSPSLPTRRRGMSASLAMRANAPPRMHGLRTDYDDVPQLPIGSMYGIFTNICPKNHPNVAKYTIHGADGLYGHKLGYTTDEFMSPSCLYGILPMFSGRWS